MVFNAGIPAGLTGGGVGTGAVTGIGGIVSVTTGFGTGAGSKVGIGGIESAIGLGS